MTRIRKKKKRSAKRAKKQRTPPVPPRESDDSILFIHVERGLEEENRLGDLMAYCAGQVNFDED